MPPSEGMRGLGTYVSTIQQRLREYLQLLWVLIRRNRVAACVVLVVLFGAGWWCLSRIAHVTENDARVKADMITISSRVDGWVVARPVTDGEKVRTGQELIVIDQREAGLRLTELHAKADALRAQQREIVTQLQIAEVTAPAGLKSADAHLDQTRNDFRRADALVERIVSRETWDQRRAQLRQAEDAEQSARARLGDVSVLRAELEKLHHDEAQIDAQIRQQEIGLADRQVRSPINGIVDDKFVQPGEYVIPGQRLFVVHDPKSVWIDVAIKETKMANLRVGQPVDISVDAYPGRRFSGRIERIGNSATSEFALLPSPNPSGNFTKVTQRVPVRIAVAQPDDNPLRPGMMVEVDIDTSRR